MNKNDILDYVMNTPGNTNRAVLSSMLNSLVESIGGGSIPSMPIVGDGKTKLYVNIASLEHPDITIYIGCTVVGGVTIDWGDGSASEVTSSTERIAYAHNYAATGDYTISLEVTNGELVLEGLVPASDDDPPASIMGTVSYNMTSLKSVEIGDGVTSIGEGAFVNCSALTSVTIPSSVTSIGGGAFQGCLALTSIVIPSSVTSIGGWAFQGCLSLTSIVIPSSVTSIGEYAFSSCSALTSIVIPEGVTSIGEYAFNGCSALGEIHFLSSTPPTLGPDCFANVPDNCRFIVPVGAGDAYVNSLGRTVYDEDGNESGGVS